jgi:putative Holliday junction resolvase
MIVVAFDVGTKRIGVAVSDPDEQFALPVAVIERRNSRADVDRLTEIAREYGADEIVVGDPVTLAGERGPAAQQMDGFVAQLAKRFPGTIHRVDERMTTAQATKTLIAADVRRSRRKGVVDKMAAALILETFLARRRNQARA